jgi:hypothetical protein
MEALLMTHDAIAAALAMVRRSRAAFVPTPGDWGDRRFGGGRIPDWSRYGFNPQPDPPKGQQGRDLGGDWGRYGFNPQPDPPKGAQSWQSLQQQAASVGLIATPYIRWEKFEELDARARQLTSEYNAQQPATTATPAAGLWAIWGAQWTVWHAAWQNFRDSHTGFLERQGGDVVDKFEKFEAQYNEFRRRFADELGGKTTTTFLEKGRPDFLPGGEGESAITEGFKLLAGVALLFGAGFLFVQLKKANP